MTFARPEFDQACKKFIQAYAPSTRATHCEISGKLGWSWREHAYIPGFGFMERVTTTPRRRRATIVGDVAQDLVIEEETADCAAAPPKALHEVVCHQYIVLSPTFQVPTFYFSADDSSGAPLDLTEVSQIPLFRRDAFDGAQVMACAIGQCWYLHPCGTSAVVEEILEATKDDGFEAEDYHLRWLEAWFTVLSTLLDFGI